MQAPTRQCFTCHGPATHTMTQEGHDDRYACESCLTAWRDHGALDGWTIQAGVPEPAPTPEPVVHIRQRIARKWGDSFYRVKYEPSEDGSRTLCGAPAGRDMAWGETRYAKNLAYVTCDECKRLRQT
ncbi:MAG: hypothetical protein HOY79_33745 [Streptomyces sp.]|nr:hypothetical protein [Streptomyces sp.]NUS11343.1 hypothetical protein [Streptomyces sp.]NUS23381.1 hypothetical protein [Streptomyces sp.]